MVEPVDLSGLAAFRPLLPALLPPELPPTARDAALADLEDRLDPDDVDAVPAGDQGNRERDPGGRPAGREPRSRIADSLRDPVQRVIRHGDGARRRDVRQPG